MPPKMKIETVLDHSLQTATGGGPPPGMYLSCSIYI
jgi:hypothetical protein